MWRKVQLHFIRFFFFTTQQSSCQTLSVHMFADSSKDHFLCSICRNVFSDPVTIPCGHSFCKTCITRHWKINVQCQCPSCKEVFYPKPKLRVNTLISEMVAQQKNSSTRTRVALMICLVLIACSVSYYKTRDAEEYPKTGELEERSAKLEKLDPELQHLIKMGRRTIEQVKSSVQSNKKDSVRIKDGLLGLRQTQAKLNDMLKEKLENIFRQAEDFVEELQQEISELESMQRQAVLKRISDYVLSFFLIDKPTRRRSREQGVTSDEL